MKLNIAKMYINEFKDQKFLISLKINLGHSILTGCSA